MLEKNNKSQIEWLIKIMAKEGFVLDSTIKSFIEIDKFFQLNYKNGELLRRSAFKEHSLSFFVIYHSLTLYIEEILLKIPETKIITEHDEVLNETFYGVLVGNIEVYTLQKLINRAHNGFSHSLYPFYFEVTKSYFNEDFQNSFYEIEKLKPAKVWWQIW